MTQTMQTPAMLIELDGIIYKSDQCIDGVQEFLQYLDASDHAYLFVTNRGNRTPGAVAASLVSMGQNFWQPMMIRVITVEDGLIPEAGPIVAAIQNASATAPTIIGKPHATIVNSACRRMRVVPVQCIIVGDNLYTDILTGVNHGLHSALVLTGVTRADDPGLKQIKPTWVVNNLVEFSDILDTA